MTKHTFHVVSLPHTQTTKEYLSCAYTEKVRKFCNMMSSLGNRVYLYASEENEAICDEFITVITKKEQYNLLGMKGPETLDCIRESWLNLDHPVWKLVNFRLV
jgi:hypothetical protein